MSRIILACSVLACVCFASPAAAQQVCPQPGCYDGGLSWGQQFHYDFYRNKHWPLPFRAQDTNAVLNYFAVQRNNGWKLQNTLGGAMFNPASHALTSAGKAHLRWILTNAPQERRTVFVLQGISQEQTAARVEATQIAISEMIPIGPLPQIYLTNKDAPGSSGTYQTNVVRALHGSVPSPRLTGAAGGSGGGTP